MGLVGGERGEARDGSEPSAIAAAIGPQASGSSRRTGPARAEPHRSGREGARRHADETAASRAQIAAALAVESCCADDDAGQALEAGLALAQRRLRRRAR